MSPFLALMRLYCGWKCASEHSWHKATGIVARISPRHKPLYVLFHYSGHSLPSFKYAHTNSVNYLCFLVLGPASPGRSTRKRYSGAASPPRRPLCGTILADLVSEQQSKECTKQAKTGHPRPDPWHAMCRIIPIGTAPTTSRSRKFFKIVTSISIQFTNVQRSIL